MGSNKQTLLLLVFAVFTTKNTTNTFPEECAKRVEACPHDQTTWEKKIETWKCPINTGYVCLRNSTGYLFETCLQNVTVQANRSNCPILMGCIGNKSYIGPTSSYFLCPVDEKGCPPKNHEGYSILQIYKYRKCIASNLSILSKYFSTMSSTKITSIVTKRKNRTSPRLTTAIYPAVTQPKDESKVADTTIAILVLSTVTVIIGIGCILSYVIYCYRKTNGRDPDPEKTRLTLKDTKEATDKLRDSIISWNKTQTGQVHFVPFKSDGLANLDDIYVQTLISEESDKSSHTLSNEEDIENITLDRIFTVKRGKQARFVFMLGEAGYGKTVQCQKLTNSWCQAWKNDNCKDDLEERLKEFDFLFFVKMRGAQHKSLIDIILDNYRQFLPSKECLDNIRSILIEGQFKSLVILDGLDEWDIPRDSPLENGIPNYRNMTNCTILITMRSWKFLEIKSMRYHCIDRVVRLCGLDETGFKFFAERLLCDHLKMDKSSVGFKTIMNKIQGFMSTSAYAASSLMKVPILAVYCILIFHQNVQIGNSLTNLYLSILEILMKRSKMCDKPERSCTDFESVSGELEDYWHVKNHIKDLSHLGKIAFSGLTSENKALIFRREDLNEKIGKTILESYLEIGLLIKADTSGQLHKDNVEISFLHKTLQELLAAIYLWKEEKTIEDFLSKHVIDVRRALEFSMVLTFISGLSAADGCQISRRITYLASQDNDIQNFRLSFSSDSYETVFHLYELQLKCYREVRRQQSIKSFREADQLQFSLSDIILHGKDTYRWLIRESADVLLHHPHDIDSLQMKFIPDDEQNGITNDELNNFLDKSTSIKSVNIDGYVDGQCRVFTHFSEKMKQLTTLGLHNIAIEGEILRDLFTKNTLRSFQALGIFCIRSSEDPKVKFQYKFVSGKTLPSQRSGFERKERIRALPTSNSHNNEDSGKPLLKDILRVLPDFDLLTTLHVSYMESLEDRNILLGVAKELKIKGQLKNFGYRGSSMYNVADDQHDTEIIEVIFTMNQLEYIFLCDIALNDKFPVFPEMLQLKDFSLQDISLNEMEWRKLVTALSDLSKKACLANVILTDTDIDNESFKLLKVAPRLKIKMIPT